MIKYIMLVLCLLNSSFTWAHDALFYKLNPNKLEKVIASCPKAKDVSCSELKKIALRVNELAYELRLNPQGFGQKILMLQEEIANQNQPKEIKNSKQELQERLAIVKWLESPES